MSDSRRNATRVEVVFDDGGIHGVVRDGGGGETPFSGWLSLIAAIETCRDEGQDDAPGASSPEPFDPGLG